MKKQILSITLFTGILTASAQVNTGTTTIICDFENVTTPNYNNKVYNDSTGGGGFASGNAFFPTQWDNTYDYWSGGWAASSVYDSTTIGSAYGCAAYKGYNNSNKFAIGTMAMSGGLTIRLTDSLIGKTVLGTYISNSTYTYKSMLNGDQFAHKFTATNKDWFKLTVKKYFSGNLGTDSSEIYLADFRYTDTTQNYILKNWMWVSFSSLGNVDSLSFTLSSSDNSFGYMNTPAFFCIDNFTLNTQRDTLEVTGIKKYFASTGLNIYPNPAVNEAEIVYNTTASVPVDMKLIDLLGNELITQKAQSFTGLNKFKTDVAALPAGVYYVTLKAGNDLLTQKLIKQ